MKKEIITTIIIISLLIVVMALCSCARINTIDFTETGFVTKTRGEVDLEVEFLPDGTKKAKFSSKKGKSMWQKIAEYVRPDSVTLGK